MTIKFNEFREPIASEKVSRDPWDAPAWVPYQKIRMLGPGREPASLPERKPPRDTEAELLAKRRALIAFFANKNRRLDT